MYTKEEKHFEQKEKEKIIGRWRKIGFLFGLKENSETERRAAMSYENMARTLMDLQDNDYSEDVLEKLDGCTSFTFPIIRDCLTTKNRINHVLLPEQVLWPLLHLSCEELFESVAETNPKFKKRINAHNKIRKFLELNDDFKKKVIDVLMRYQTKVSLEDDEKIPNSPTSLETFKVLTDLDLDAWLCDMVSDYIKLKSHEFDEGLLPWDEEIPYRNPSPEEQEKRERINEMWKKIGDRIK